VNNIISVFLYEFKRNLLRRGFLFTTFGLPALAIAIFLGLQAFNDGGTPTSTEQLAEYDFQIETVEVAGYVDESGLFEEPSGDNPLTGILIAFDTTEAARTALDADEIDAYYSIPADYAETGQVQLVLPTFSLTQVTSGPFDSLVYSQILDQVDPFTLSLLVQPASYTETLLERDETLVDESASTGNTGLANAFAFLLILGLFTTNGYLMQSLIEEKETRIIEILISSVKPVQLLIGKIFALGALGLFQITVYLIALLIASQIGGDALSFLADVDIAADVLLLTVVYFIMGYLLFAALFGTVGVIANSVSEAPNLTIIFVLPATVPLILADTIVQEPGGTLATTLSYFPLTAPMAMVMRLSVGSVPVADIIVSLVILSASIVGMMWLAGRFFRVQTLLAGKRPALKDLPQIVFGS